MLIQDTATNVLSCEMQHGSYHYAVRETALTFKIRDEAQATAQPLKVYANYSHEMNTVTVHAACSRRSGREGSVHLCTCWVVGACSWGPLSSSLLTVSDVFEK